MKSKPLLVDGGSPWETRKIPAPSPNDPVYIRVANLEDAKVMAELEAEVWDDQHAAEPNKLERRLRANTGCTIIAFDANQNRPVGFFTFVALSEEKVSILGSWEHYAEMANSIWESGEVHYGVSLTVSKTAVRGTGTCIMQAAKEYSQWLGAKRIIAITRVPGFHRVQAVMTFNEYYNLLLSGEMNEPLYFLFSSAGWKLVGYCSNYYSDPESADYGLHFEVSFGAGTLPLGR
jgi:hypothetical protein